MLAWRAPDGFLIATAIQIRFSYAASLRLMGPG